MVLIKKTYSGTTRLFARVATALLVFLGFFYAIFNATPKTSYVSDILDTGSVAHADAAACGSTDPGGGSACSGDGGGAGCAGCADSSDCSDCSGDCSGDCGADCSDSGDSGGDCG